jgi:hypothetical protein
MKKEIKEYQNRRKNGACLESPLFMESSEDVMKEGFKMIPRRFKFTAELNIDFPALESSMTTLVIFFSGLITDPTQASFKQHKNIFILMIYTRKR